MQDTPVTRAAYTWYNKLDRGLLRFVVPTRQASAIVDQAIDAVAEAQNLREKYKLDTLAKKNRRTTGKTLPQTPTDKGS